ncbi:hypothetical protein [Labrys neptuniae]
MSDKDELAIAKAWLERETAADAALGKLLAGVPEGLFGPEPKRISKEHFDLIVKTSGQNDKSE